MISLQRTTDMDSYPTRPTSAAQVATRKAVATRKRRARRGPTKAQTAAMSKYIACGASGLSDDEKSVLRPYMAQVGIKVTF